MASDPGLDTEEHLKKNKNKNPFCDLRTGFANAEISHTTTFQTLYGSESLRVTSNYLHYECHSLKKRNLLGSVDLSLQRIYFQGSRNPLVYFYLKKKKKKERYNKLTQL